MTPTQMQMHCTHAPYYQKGCIPCMARHIKAMRSPDHKTTKKLQLSLLASVPLEVADKVKALLKAES